MLFQIFAASFISGILGAMGFGSGTVLIIWLTSYLSYGQLRAQGVNLMFFIPCAAVSLLLLHKKGYVEIRRALPIIFGGLIGIFIGQSLIGFLPAEHLRRLFGGFVVHTDIAAQMGFVNFADVDTVNFEQPLSYGIKSLEQFGECGFAGTGTSDETDGFSGIDFEGEVFDDLRQIRTVLEGDIFKFDAAFECVADTAACGFRRGIHDNAEHADGEGNLLIFVDESDNLDQRTGNAVCKHLERDQRTDTDNVIKDQMSADPDNADGHHHFEHLAYALCGH